MSWPEFKRHPAFHSFNMAKVSLWSQSDDDKRKLSCSRKTLHNVVYSAAVRLARRTLIIAHVSVSLCVMADAPVALSREVLFQNPRLSANTNIRRVIKRSQCRNILRDVRIVKIMPRVVYNNMTCFCNVNTHLTFSTRYLYDTMNAFVVNNAVSLDSNLLKYGDKIYILTCADSRFNISMLRLLNMPLLLYGRRQECQRRPTPNNLATYN